MNAHFVCKGSAAFGVSTWTIYIFSVEDCAHSEIV